MILAGDIGGTKTILAFFQGEGGRLRPIVEATFPSREHANLDEIVSKFVSFHNLPLTHACFGIAGPVKHGRSETTNLPWVVDAKVLASKLGLETVGLINDVEANAYGIAALAPTDFIVLNQGAKEAEGNAAIISAGTGLGEAGLYWDGQQHRPFACEGGHADFAPRNCCAICCSDMPASVGSGFSPDRVCITSIGSSTILVALRSQLGLQKNCAIKTRPQSLLK